MTIQARACYVLACLEISLQESSVIDGHYPWRHMPAWHIHRCRCPDRQRGNRPRGDKRNRDDNENHLPHGLNPLLQGFSPWETESTACSHDVQVSRTHVAESQSDCRIFLTVTDFGEA